MMGEPVRALAPITLAFASLRLAEDSPTLLRLASAALAGLGFERVLISRIEDGALVPEALHLDSDPDGAARLVEPSRARAPRLQELELETDVARRRRPALVVDARVEAPLPGVFGSRSYVVAPIVFHGSTQGLVHADHGAAGARADEGDCDLVGLFAEGLGQAQDRVALSERLRALRLAVRRGNESILAVLAEAPAVELAAGGLEHVGELTPVPVPRPVADPVGRLESLLTRRELEVVKRMAVGETNAQIADGLVVSEATVKSHVAHILRKLRASNRAEAVSRVIGLARRERGGTV